MTRRLPPLNALRAFEAAARLGSFKAAAAEANVTHGAISRHIQLLETWLGGPLFERHNRRIVLTETARAYLAEVGQALDRVAAATDTFGTVKYKRVLRIQVLATFAVRWLLPRLGRFQAAHPDVEVRIVTLSEPIEAQGTPYDIAIRFGPDTFEGLEVRPFLHERRLPVCSPDLLRRLPLSRPEDLRRHTLIYSLSQPRVWGRWLSHAGVTDLEPAGSLHFDHVYVALEAAAGALGVAMGPTALIGADLAAGRLVTPFPDLSDPARSYCAYVPEPLKGDATTEAFCAWLGREAAGEPAAAPRIADRRRRTKARP